MTKSPVKNRPGRAVWLRRALWVSLLLAVVVLLVLAWLPQPVAVDLAEVTRGAMEVAVEEDGRTRVKDRYLISAPVYGQVARIALEPGASVEEGAVLARLAPLSSALLDPRSQAEAEARVAAATAAVRQSETSVERVQAALEFAERELARQEQLFAQRAVAPQAVERAELDVRQRREELASARFGTRVAQHELEMARATLRQAQGDRSLPRQQQLDVRSPVSGVVLRVLQESEGVVQAGTPLLEVGEPHALEIVVDVLTQDAVRIRRGSLAWIEHWGGDAVLSARVRAVEPSAFTRMSALGVEEQRVNVILEFDAPYETWASLGDGYRVETHIVTWQDDDVLQVPDSAVFRHQGQHAVFRVENGAARLRRVTVGRRDGRRAQILEGLTAGEHVVEYPGDRVQDGSAVRGR